MNNKKLYFNDKREKILQEFLNNGDYHWSLLLTTVNSEEKLKTIKFRFHKETFELFKVEDEWELFKCSEEDISLFLSYEKGKKIAEQVKMIGNEFKTFESKNEGKMKFMNEYTVRDAENTLVYVFELSFENSPLILRVLYDFESNEFNLHEFYLSNIASQDAMLAVPKSLYDFLFVKAVDIIKKTSIQRLRLITKNSP